MDKLFKNHRRFTGSPVRGRMGNGGVDVKVVLLGKSFAGKTSLVERYMYNRFVGNTLPYSVTVGAAYGSKTIKIDDKDVVLGIWDTAGHERFEAMSKIYYRGARAAIIVYDLTDTTSFDRARFWIRELLDHERNCKIYLCGSKVDIVEKAPESRRIKERETRQLAANLQADVFETSSQSGKDIEKLFNKIATDYLSLKEEQVQSPKENLGEVHLWNKASRSCCLGACGS